MYPETRAMTSIVPVQSVQGETPLKGSDRVGVVINAVIPKLERLRWEYLKVCGQSGLYHEFQSNMSCTASPCLNTLELYK